MLVLFNFPSPYLLQSSCFASVACPTKTASPFVGVQTGCVCLRQPFNPVAGFGADKRGTYLPSVDRINSISWCKRKVGPGVYVTEQGTLESATAP